MNTIDQHTVAQLRAIECPARDIVTIAGPGSGKTRVTSERVRLQIECGVPPAEIVAITYTNDAARELEGRIHTACLRDGPSNVGAHFRLGYAGTLHGFCLRMLRDYGAADGYGPRTAVVDESAADELLESKARTVGTKTPLAKLRELRKAGRPAPGRMTPDQLVICAYFDELRSSGLVDYDSILTEFFRLLTAEFSLMATEIRGRFSRLFVDEIQDSAEIDWGIYRALPIYSKFFVGDPDQGIFGFRGGRPELLVRYAAEALPARQGELILLEENFRSTPPICTASQRLISRNQMRVPKHNFTRNEGGDPVRMNHLYTEGEEIGWVLGQIQEHALDQKDTAVLARTNAIAAEFRDAIRAAGLPVIEPPSSKLPRDWALARSLIELAAAPNNDTLAFFYAVSKEISAGATPAAARAKAHELRRMASSQGQTVNSLFLKLDAKDWLDLAEILRREGLCRETIALVTARALTLPPGSGPLELAAELATVDKGLALAQGGGITCTTIHAAKGREWTNVFIVGAEDEVFPGKTADPGEIEEERRLFFVGMTRAKRRLFLSASKTRRANWGPKPMEARTLSRFVKEALT